MACTVRKSKPPNRLATCSQESECRGQGDVFPELVRGVPEGDPVFGGLEGLAISVVVVCLSVTEVVQPPGTEML